MAPADRTTIRRTRSDPGKQEAGVHLGDSLLHVGKLRFAFERGRRHSEFSYSRIPYISARTALQRDGTEQGAYTEISQFIQQHSDNPART